MFTYGWHDCYGCEYGSHACYEFQYGSVTCYDCYDGSDACYECYYCSDGSFEVADSGVGQHSTTLAMLYFSFLQTDVSIYDHSFSFLVLCHLLSFVIAAY